METISASLDRGRRNDTFANLGLALALLTTVAITAVGAVATSPVRPDTGCREKDAGRRRSAGSAPLGGRAGTPVPEPRSERPAGG